MKGWAAGFNRESSGLQHLGQERDVDHYHPGGSIAVRPTLRKRPLMFIVSTGGQGDGIPVHRGAVSITVRSNAARSLPQNFCSRSFGIAPGLTALTRQAIRVRA